MTLVHYVLMSFACWVLIVGHLAVGQRACQVLLERQLNLNSFLQISQHGFQQARAEATNCAGMSN